MKLPNITILDEVDKRLRKKSSEVTFPLSTKDKQNIEDMITYLKMSQIPEYEEEYDLRAGMGLAYIQMIYVGEGEGCLSINREVEGIVPRFARVTIEYLDLDGNTKRIRVREDIAIAFQHEIDHLNGILFIDHIDPKNPYKNAEKYREI